MFTQGPLRSAQLARFQVDVQGREGLTTLASFDVAIRLSSELPPISLCTSLKGEAVLVARDALGRFQHYDKDAHLDFIRCAMIRFVSNSFQRVIANNRCPALPTE